MTEKFLAIIRMGTSSEPKDNQAGSSGRSSIPVNTPRSFADVVKGGGVIVPGGEWGLAPQAPSK